jgi:hypothetical protein
MTPARASMSNSHFIGKPNETEIYEILNVNNFMTKPK